MLGTAADWGHQGTAGHPGQQYSPRGSMPVGLPGIGRSPGVLLVPGVGASFLGVGVFDLSPGVDDLSFWIEKG